MHHNITVSLALSWFCTTAFCNLYTRSIPPVHETFMLYNVFGPALGSDLMVACWATPAQGAVSYSSAGPGCLVSVQGGRIGDTNWAADGVPPSGVPEEPSRWNRHFITVCVRVSSWIQCSDIWIRSLVRMGNPKSEAKLWFRREGTETKTTLKH